MDAERAARIIRIHGILRQVLDDSPVGSEPACDVIPAIIAQAIAMSKVLGSTEDEFFDLCVKMYEWTQVERVKEKH